MSFAFPETDIKMKSLSKNNVPVKKIDEWVIKLSELKVGHKNCCGLFWK